MEYDEFLSLLEVPKNSKQYVLGPFDSGITLLRQQTRALNLIYALAKSKRLKSGTKIAIIGGGVAGVTAAAAAAKQKCAVTLIEQRHTLIHLQQGCDTRWLHPHIYDWPEADALHEYSGLPILDWHASSASSVAKQILHEFETIQKTYAIYVCLGATLQSVAGGTVSWSSTKPKQNYTRKFDIVIFAVGFGVERNVNSHWPAYWRNDSIHQSDPRLESGKTTSILISGTGDGGLIDLMRTTISEFNHSSIHKELFGNYHKLFEQLILIKNEWQTGDALSIEGWLYDKYDSLDQDGYLDDTFKNIKLRIRPDTDVTLNGKHLSFRSSIRLDNASMFTTLVSFCLHRHSAFNYRSGKLTISQDVILLADEKVTFDQIILRHGADTKKTFEVAKCIGIDSILTSSDDIRRYFNTAKRLWPVGWWDGESKVEHVSKPTVTVATTFVSTLRDMLELASNTVFGIGKDAPLDFRVTMHRITEIQGNHYYQQIARYAGSKRQIEGKVGRVFSVSAGLGGLCCRIGQPVKLLQGKGFDELKQELELSLTPARPIAAGTESFVTVPFFYGDVKEGFGHRSVSLLLYVSSNKASFFSDAILKTIYTACRGFVENIEAMIGHDEITLSHSESKRFFPLRSESDVGLLDKYKEILSTDKDIFGDYADDLTFKSVKYFEVSQGL